MLLVVVALSIGKLEDAAPRGGQCNVQGRRAGGCSRGRCGAEEEQSRADTIGGGWGPEPMSHGASDGALAY